MKLTKYQHACFAVEQDNQILVVDPGEWTTDFIAEGNVIAIFISHEHFDHCNQERISAVIDKNPNALIISNQDVLNKITVTATKKSVRAGETISVGPFLLEFFGGQHATIRPDLQPITNLGIMINDTVYYPGDSFTVPNKPVDTLALPVSAPWLKISESLDFFAAIQSRLTFPTHDAILSDYGKAGVDSHIINAAKNLGSIYTRIDGQTIEL